METKDAKIETKEVKLNNLELKELPILEKMEVKDNLDQAVLVTQSFSEMINAKQALTQQLKESVEKEIQAKLEYQRQFDDQLVNTDFETVLNKSRVNKDEKESYIRNQIRTAYEEKVITEENTKIIKKQLEVLDNRISLEKTILGLVQTSGGLNE